MLEIKHELVIYIYIDIMIMINYLIDMMDGRIGAVRDALDSGIYNFNVYQIKFVNNFFVLCRMNRIIFLLFQIFQYYKYFLQYICKKFTYIQYINFFFYVNKNSYI
jgi:hypothetical protein